MSRLFSVLLDPYCASLSKGRRIVLRSWQVRASVDVRFQTALICPLSETSTDPRFEAFEFEGRFFVNPGSATGAWSGLWNGYVIRSRLQHLTLYTRRKWSDCSDATPSFALMDVQGPVIVTYVYQLVDGEVSLDIRSNASVLRLERRLISGQSG